MQPTEKSTPQLPPTKNKEKKHENMLIQQIQSINQWDSLSGYDKQDAVEDFMDAVGRLYLNYYQFHLNEAKACGVKYQSILQLSFDPIITYISELEGKLRSADDMDDPWEAACWGRTNIEAFMEMFDAPKDIIEFWGIDNYMRDRKGKADLDDDQIPKNALSSHWWWFEKYGKNASRK